MLKKDIEKRILTSKPVTQEDMGGYGDYALQYRVGILDKPVIACRRDILKYMFANMKLIGLKYSDVSNCWFTFTKYGYIRGRTYAGWYIKTKSGEK